MRILDLFCCEGGAAVGYHRAGWDVVGVDIDPQPRYPFAFVQGDALAVMRGLLAGGRIFSKGDEFALSDFDAIHASPPCQAYSVTRHTHDKAHPDLIGPTRELLIASGLPYVIENVSGAAPYMVEPLLLCGSHFGLSAQDTDGTKLRMERHRLFESNRFLMAPGVCVHDTRVQVAGAYGGGSSDLRHAKDVRRGGYTPAKAVREALLGIDWMTIRGLSQSIPPAYTEWVGEQLAWHLAPVG